MKTRQNAFIGVFILLVLLDLVTGYLHFQGLRQFTKPLILLSLLLFFGIYGKQLASKTYSYSLLALFFSLMGDIFLLYDHLSPLYFMLGLIAFLLAHITYAIVFLIQGKTIFKKEIRLVAFLLLVYGTTLFIILQDHLGPLTMPVIIYILGILAMAVTAYSRKDQVDPTSFKLVFIGALFFILSDSILALNKFVVSIPGSHILVMGTYATAQYLIVRGLLARKD
ncbi:lysoplasmalogenase [Arenibacter echinorum]|uniref:Putative membrane protein YhhN n=1 Tax=Arenibacter echinorum TaxID=440515 RepID=A0A327R6A6_9FLAO|nr:lysoplasmalogenase [Arenibacter echinorum]RAJ12390.1 putative membrane protein YhhN [Arenibacter echinorum]